MLEDAAVEVLRQHHLLAEHVGAEQLTAGEEIPLYCYHSRFKLEDRRRWHRDVVAAFQQTSQAALAITTQVCEMSLELDADLLVTEQAPMTALIQRMGRCNRRALPSPGHLGEVVIYPAETPEPYTPEQLAGVPEFVARMLQRDGRPRQKIE
jgi:CRISPR-associated endonuclease/helicase Cas3